MTSIRWIAAAVGLCLAACGQNGERAPNAPERTLHTARTPALSLSPSSVSPAAPPERNDDPAALEGSGAPGSASGADTNGAIDKPAPRISGERGDALPTLASDDRAMASAPIAHVGAIDSGEPPAIPAGTGGPPPGLQRPPPSVLTPLPELCREACANAHRLVEAELAADTAKAMREEVERALERECPGRCLQRASLESARCIAGAKSALELAACP